MVRQSQVFTMLLIILSMATYLIVELPWRYYLVESEILQGQDLVEGLGDWEKSTSGLTINETQKHLCLGPATSENIPFLVRSIPLSPKSNFVRVSARSKAFQLAPGSESWQQGHILVRSFNDQRAWIWYWPSKLAVLTGSSPWADHQLTVPVDNMVRDMWLVVYNGGQSGEICLRSLHVEGFLEARADDDYGIDALTLVYSVNGEEEQSISLFSAGRRPMPEVTAGHTLYLEELGLEPGDLVSYYAIAADNRRAGDQSEVTSDIYFIQIRPFRIDYRQGEEQGGGGGGGGGGPEQGLSELQRQVVAATFNLNRDRDDYFPGEYEENLVSVRLSQARVREQVDGLHQRMVSRGIGNADPLFQRIAELLPQAIEDMKEAEAHLERGDVKAAISPEQKALLKLQKAEETYEATVQQGGQQGGQTASIPTARKSTPTPRHQPTRLQRRDAASTSREHTSHTYPRLTALYFSARMVS